MPIAGLTTRRAVVADAETMVRTAGLGFATWRAFAPAGWSPYPVEHRLAMARHFLSRSDSIYERRGWFADTLLEEHEGLPMAIYCLRLSA